MQIDNLFRKTESKESELILTKGILNADFKFSIFIPTFNRPILLQKALDSALSQDFNDYFEVVIIDNCSSFESFELIKEYLNSKVIASNIKLSLYRCQSHSNSWNMGILKSSAEWVIMLHDDDLLQSNHLSEVIKVIRLKPEITVLCSDSYNLIETNQLTYYNLLFIRIKEFIKFLRKGRLIKLKLFDFYFHNPAPNTGIVLNRSVALDLGGFNRNDDPIPDYAFLFRITKAFNNTFYLNKKLSKIRFSVNDGLKTDVILKVKQSSQLIRSNILINYQFFDFGFNKCISSLIEMEMKKTLGFFERNFKIPFLLLYTRIISLLVFAKSILF